MHHPIITSIAITIIVATAIVLRAITINTIFTSNCHHHRKCYWSYGDGSGNSGIVAIAIKVGSGSDGIGNYG